MLHDGRLQLANRATLTGAWVANPFLLSVGGVAVNFKHVGDVVPITAVTSDKVALVIQFDIAPAHKTLASSVVGLAFVLRASPSSVDGLAAGSFSLWSNFDPGLIGPTLDFYIATVGSNVQPTNRAFARVPLPAVRGGGIASTFLHLMAVVPGADTTPMVAGEVSAFITSADAAHGLFSWPDAVNTGVI
jgi:hypothetical protein